MRATLLAAPLLLATLAGATTSDTRALDRELAGRVAGQSVKCVSLMRTDGPRAYGDRTLLYNDGRRIWRNDLPAACPGLNDDAIVVSEVYGGQLCRNDQFYTLQRSGGRIPGPRCRLGNFVPYVKVKP